MAHFKIPLLAFISLSLGRRYIHDYRGLKRTTETNYDLKKKAGFSESSVLKECSARVFTVCTVASFQNTASCTLGVTFIYPAESICISWNEKAGGELGEFALVPQSLRSGLPMSLYQPPSLSYPKLCYTFFDLLMISRRIYEKK